MNIKKLTGTITKIVDLSVTAKDVTIALPEELQFEAGSFVNVFMDVHGQKVRRAFSIASSDTIQDSITLSIRHNTQGLLSPVFWNRIKQVLLWSLWAL